MKLSKYFWLLLVTIIFFSIIYYDNLQLEPDDCKYFEDIMPSVYL